MFVVNTFSELDEVMQLQVQELLLRGDISEQVLNMYVLVNSGDDLNGAHREAVQIVCRQYDVLDFSGQGKLAWLLLSRHGQNKTQK